MPKLSVFGRQLDVGSDDLYIHAVAEAVATGVGLGMLGTVYARNSHTVYFTEGSHVKYFYVGGIILASVNMALLLSIAHYSLKGTVVNTWPRRHLKKLLLAKMGLGVVVFLFAIPCTKWVFFTQHPAGDVDALPIATLHRAVVALWSVIGFSVVFWRNTFHELSQVVQRSMQNMNKNFQRKETLKTVAVTSWRQIVQRAADMLQLHGHPEVHSLANLVEDFFQEEPVDTVTTDTLASLILLVNEQEQKCGEVEQSDVGVSGAEAHTPCLQAWMNQRNIAHFARYAAAVYGLSVYMKESPGAALWGLLKAATRHRFAPRSLSSHIVGDGNLMLNTSYFKMKTNLTDNDIVYASYYNKLFEIPFVVSLDHAREAVVVTVRGTLSLEDVFVDMVAFESEEIPIPGQKDIRVHQGMFRTAQYIQRKLLGLDDEGCSTGQGLLDKAWHHLAQDVGHERADGYRLVITGHSLGAGTAAVLALFMRQYPKYSNLQCFAFSPPAGLMRLTASRYCEDFVYSVIVGDDIVGRLSLRSLFEFRSRLLKKLKHCDVPKHKIYGGWLYGLIGKLLGSRAKASEGPGDNPSWKDDPEAAAVVTKWQNDVEAAIVSNERKKEQYVKLYPPGCILHITEAPLARGFFGGTGYTYSYTHERGDCRRFGEIAISANLLRHHMSDTVLMAVNALNQN